MGFSRQVKRSRARERGSFSDRESALVRAAREPRFAMCGCAGEFDGLVRPLLETCYGRASPRASLATPLFRARPAPGGQARMAGMTLPATSVRRKSRPLKRYV